MSTTDDAGGRPEQITLARLKVPKASEVLANELSERILSGEFAEGAGLPPERELVSQTGLSRTTVREALRILEVQGLIRIKSGRAGGAFIQRPGELAMANTVEDIIRGREIRRSALLETRRAIEPFCARLAVRTRTDEQLEELQAAIPTVNGEWHIAVARASNNALLSGLMLALSNAISEATDRELVDRGKLDQAVEAHELITAAIRDRDEEGAVEEMEKHAHVYSEADEIVGRR
ncbi:MAG TPA: FCD domain-containing protein [Microbacterium sp.]|nr:FCD domain-containing protein [Microbacterium sp.]